MRTLLLATAAVAAIAATVPAEAADLSVAPAYPAYYWVGFYVGPHLGGTWASNNFVQTVAVGTAVESATINSSGFVFGGQVGFNWLAAPNWLLGMEADVSGADLHNSAQTIPGTGGAAVVGWTEKVGPFGTVRGRLGYVAGNWLFYGTGGFAWADDLFTRTQLVAGASSPVAGLVTSNSPTRTGWTAGGGIEWGFTRYLTARIEYLHLDLGSQNFGFITRSVQAVRSASTHSPSTKAGSPSIRFG
jgi:outer membrane immunogenic protein